MRTDILERKAEILSWIDEGQTKKFMCEELNCKITTLNSYLKKLNVKYEGNQSGKGLLKSKVPLDDILSNRVRFYDGPLLKKRLIYEGLLKDECNECGLTEWNGKPIVLELEHINGDNLDNRIENLRILCPNCHSQTPTFRRKKSSLNKSGAK